MTDERRDMLQRRMSKDLKSIGIYPHLQGFKYIISIVLFGMENELRPITKVGYKHVADEFDMTTSQVERSIRHAIGTAYSKCDPKIWKSFLGICSDECLSNYAFISLLIDHYLNG